MLAGLTMLMAGAAFVHTLITSVRVQRHPLAVAKALGWSRTQVGRSIFWHASFLALPAILVGVPAGVVLGRWGWGVVSHSLGVPSVPVVPLALLVAIAVAALDRRERPRHLAELASCSHRSRGRAPQRVTVPHWLGATRTTDRVGGCNGNHDGIRNRLWERRRRRG